MSKKISDERLEELCKTLKPVVRKDGKLFYIEDIYPHSTAITWDLSLKQKPLV